MRGGYQSLTAFILSIGLVQGAEVNLAGTVTDDTGAPLEGATVLIVGENLETQTDASGHYSIEQLETTLRDRTAERGPRIAAGIGRVSLLLHSLARVRVDIFDTKGRLIAATADAELPAGRHSVPVFGAKPPSGVFVVKARVGIETWTFRYMTLSRGPIAEGDPQSASPPLRKTAAVVDTLRVTKTGYVATSLPLESYVGTVDVELAKETVEGFGSCEGKPTKPLPSFDFSHVGYRQGAALPSRSATKTFPAGTTTVTEQIVLKSGDVLRGAGRDKTILYFPGGLKQMGFPCRNGEIITVTGGGTGDCYDWTSNTYYMGVIGARGSEIGIEDLTIEFPADHAWTHHGNYNYTSGYNGIDLNKCTDCWVRNVSIVNSDNGIFVSGGNNNTLDGLHIYARPGGGHIHIAFSTYTKNNLATNFRAYGTSSHGLTMNWGTENNVYANGWGENIRIEPDHNCNGTGGASSCSKNMLYSNIAGKIASLQTKDRAGNTLPTILWNVGSVDRCPLDAYTAQRQE